jgi:hypothetical protein
MIGYATMRFWSPLLGSPAVRLSMVDDRGGEFYSIIAVDRSAKAYRAARDRALDAIEEAIYRGDEPGEVRHEERSEAA